MRKIIIIKKYHIFLLTYLLFIGFMSLMSNKVLAQTHENTVKAVFLERFTRFVNWPENHAMEDTAKPFIIGIIDNKNFIKILENLYSSQKIKNKPVKIKNINTLNDVYGCHLLFIGSEDRININKLISETIRLGILTISDKQELAEMGVLINFYIQDNKIRFEINESTLKESGLYMSHLLLKEARIVQSERGNR